jgi:hypothetical protein
MLGSLPRLFSHVRASRRFQRLFQQGNPGNKTHLSNLDPCGTPKYTGVSHGPVIFPLAIQLPYEHSTLSRPAVQLFTQVADAPFLVPGCRHGYDSGMPASLRERGDGGTASSGMVSTGRQMMFANCNLLRHGRLSVFPPRHGLKGRAGCRAWGWEWLNRRCVTGLGG